MKGAPISKYLEDYKKWLLWRGLRERTISGYTKRIVRFISDIGDLKADKIKKKHIVEWIIRLRQRGSNDYVITCLWAIRSFLKYLNEEAGIRTYNFEKLRIPKRTKKKHVTVLTNEEIRTLLSAINITNIHGLRLRTYIELLLNTGLRPSEALSLSRKDVENLPDELEIEGKGGKRRIIYFNDRVKYWIKRYLEAREDDHPALFITHCKPNAWSLRRAEEAFHNLVQKMKLTKKATPHTLRHTFGTNLLKHGCPVDYIARLLGHSDPKTTRIYYLSIEQEDIKLAHKKYLNYND